MWFGNVSMSITLDLWNVNCTVDPALCVYLFWTKDNEELFILMTIMANMSRGSDHCFFSGCSSDHRCPYSEQLAILELYRELGRVSNLN